MDKRAYGRVGEDSAASYLKRRGYNIVGQNVYVGKCELDIIAENGELLLFVEVKTRRQRPDVKSIYGRPATAVDSKKRVHLLEAASRYLYENRESTRHLQPRIDIIEVYADPSTDSYRVLDIRHFPNAVHR